MDIGVENSQPTEHLSDTKSNPVYALLLFGLVSWVLVSFLSIPNWNLLANISSSRFLFATGGIILGAIGVNTFHNLFKTQRMRESQVLLQHDLVSNDEFSETKLLRSSIYSNNVCNPNDTTPNVKLTPFCKKCEEPVSFFLLDEGGLRIASIDFCRRERVDENLVAGFLSAIQAFSDQVFAQSVSQIKLDDYTLLMKAYSPFTFVYVFRGPVEPAEEKLDRIIRNLSEAPKEWSAITETRYTGRVLSDDSRYAVESMVRLNLGIY